jgi:hypothetical protein
MDILFSSPFSKRRLSTAQVRPLRFTKASDYIVTYFYLYQSTIRLVHEFGKVRMFGSVEPRQAVFFTKKTPTHLW